MSERRDEFYTITVAPERTGRVRYYVLTRRHIRLLVLSGGLVLLIGLAAGLQMWRTVDSVQEVKELRRQELALRTQLDGADDQLTKISERLESLDQLEKRLRGLAQGPQHVVFIANPSACALVAGVLGDPDRHDPGLARASGADRPEQHGRPVASDLLGELEGSDALSDACARHALVASIRTPLPSPSAESGCRYMFRRY